MNLCWFRADLRLRDNPALAAALEAGPTVALYIATPGQWRAHDDAPVKLDFWRRNLDALERDLAGIGVPLVCCQVADYAAIPDLLDRIMEAWPVSGVYCNAEYPLNESRRDESVRVLCDDSGIGFHRYHDQVLLAPGSVLNGSGEPFKVFTPFARKCRGMIHAPTVAAAPTGKQAPPGSLPTVAGQCALEKIDWPPALAHWQSLWPAGEAAARKRLQAFCGERIAAYKSDRDYPAVDGTSTLSPWLAAGVLSIRDCWTQATATHHGEGPETWKNELLWRDFYKHILFHYPHVSRGRPFRDDYGHVPWRDDGEDFAAWCEGRTGIPIVDAAMRQLADTGWMHNRLRMVAAMFLAKHLLLDWRLGERWFMQHLVDGDFAANNGGWQWSASTGTDAVPYFRVFNPVTQSRRFDARGEFIRRYVPELGDLDDKAIHEPGLLAPAGYPAPMIDLKAGRERALRAFKRR